MLKKINFGIKKFFYSTYDKHNKDYVNNILLSNIPVEKYPKDNLFYITAKIMKEKNVTYEEATVKATQILQKSYFNFHKNI